MVMYPRGVGLRRSAWAIRTFAYHASYNALARAAPRVSAAIQRLTRDTGRGRGRDGAAGAAYFEAVLADYLVIADASGVGGADLFRGKHVLELGPGDTRAIALLARLEGASAWEGFDPFDIQSRRSRYLEAIYDVILAHRGEPRWRAEECLERAVVHTSDASLRRQGPRFQVIVSRAVLEHVRDLGTLFAVAASVATDDAVWIHKVDLRSHGIRHTHELDFLRFTEPVWHAMSSHVDLPNRIRAAAYLDVGDRVGLRTTWAASTHGIAPDEVERVRAELAAPFRDMHDLSVLGLWLVQVGRGHPLASRPAKLDPAPHERLSHY
jgi:hypothetical protein